MPLLQCDGRSFVGLRDTRNGYRIERRAAPFVWIAQGVGAITAVALAIATHDVLPFVFALLLALTVVEYARVRSYSQPVWPLIALVTDGAVWGMIFIYSGPQNARAEYPELGVVALVFPACLLFAINATSVAVRAILQEHKITVFEIVQVMIAFGLADFQRAFLRAANAKCSFSA